jgi:hypothetical protein
MDCANWYPVSGKNTKKQQALYPAMGRRHVQFLSENRLVFNAQPKATFRSIGYVYVVVDSQVFRVDKNFQQELITSPGLELKSGADIWFAFLPVQTTVYCMFTDGDSVFVCTESPSSGFTWEQATGTGVPTSPAFIAAFGNRFVVSNKDSTQWFLTNTNMSGTSSTWFDISAVPGGSLFNSASGVIRQMATLHNQLYIFTDFSCDIWSNIPTQITVASSTATFPFKLNSSYNWDYGMADPFSLDVDFGMMVWLARNRNGLVTFMMSNGQQPQDISSQAVDVLLEQDSASNELSPFLTEESDGFLYQWENSIFYRVSAGKFLSFGDLDIQDSANSLEYNFGTQTWHRVIELNGERNRIQRHVFFNNKHLVTVEDDTAIYEMAGDLYFNELRNADQPDTQAVDAFTKYPMRYELTTQQIYQPDYSEFVTDYVEIDFVFGDQTFYKNNAPFINTAYLITEDSTPDAPVYIVSEDDEFIIQDGTNTPTFDDNHYNALFKPHIELYISDDGGVTFASADIREFSKLGVYRWKMRWYELGTSRNRVYKLVCVSSAPIVILGGVMSTRRVSGGAN